MCVCDCVPVAILAQVAMLSKQHRSENSIRSRRRTTKAPRQKGSTRKRLRGESAGPPPAATHSPGPQDVAIASSSTHSCVDLGTALAKSPSRKLGTVAPVGKRFRVEVELDGIFAAGPTRTREADAEGELAMMRASQTRNEIRAHIAGWRRWFALMGDAAHFPEEAADSSGVHMLPLSPTSSSHSCMPGEQ